MKTIKLILAVIALGVLFTSCNKTNIETETLTVTTYSFTGGISPTTTKKFISTETVFKKDVENGYFTKKVKSLSGLRLAFTVKHNYDGVQFTPEQIFNQIIEGYANAPYEYVDGGSEENNQYMYYAFSKGNTKYYDPAHKYVYLTYFLITQ